MTARMKSPAEILPDVISSVQGLYQAMFASGIDPLVLELVHLRASQVNGCAPCVFAGVTAARRHGETDERLHQVVAWRESELFTDAERSALALAESATRLADRADAVPDDVWEEAARHFEEQRLAAVVLMIALTNFFNRINVAIKEPAGVSWG